MKPLIFISLPCLALIGLAALLSFGRGRKPPVRPFTVTNDFKVSARSVPSFYDAKVKVHSLHSTIILKPHTATWWDSLLGEPSYRVDASTPRCYDVATGQELLAVSVGVGESPGVKHQWDIFYEENPLAPFKKGIMMKMQVHCKDSSQSFQRNLDFYFSPQQISKFPRE